MENGPRFKMYFLLKMGIFQPAMLVYRSVLIFSFHFFGRCSEQSSLDVFVSCQACQKISSRLVFHVDKMEVAIRNPGDIC